MFSYEETHSIPTFLFADQTFKNLDPCFFHMRVLWAKSIWAEMMSREKKKGCTAVLQLFPYKALGWLKLMVEHCPSLSKHSVKIDALKFHFSFSMAFVRITSHDTNYFVYTDMTLYLLTLKWVSWTFKCSLMFSHVQSPHFSCKANVLGVQSTGSKTETITSCVINEKKCQNCLHYFRLNFWIIYIYKHAGEDQK